MSLAPTNEDSVWLAEQNPVGKRFQSGKMTLVSVDSFCLLTTSVRVRERVEIVE